MATDGSQQADFSGDNSILNTTMTVQAMRDSRYRDPANAIAELIDNSIDAHAPKVELLVKEAQVQINSRKGNRIQQIAVLDNGIGMSPQTLTQALRFGGRVPSPGIKKIGKYGMGLPTASASQCKRVDVWSWQNGMDNSHRAYISIDEVQNGDQSTIIPTKGSPPQEWLQLAQQTVGPNGTLVVWSEIDRITRYSNTLFRNLEEEIGRIYRHYINDGTLAIRMAAFHENQSRPYADKEVKPNDPLYRMAPSSTPGGWDTQPMFNHYHKEEQFVIQDGKEQTVTIVYSIAKPEALGKMGGRPGNTDYGRHARRNTGISIVREGREILLDTSLQDTSRGGGSLAENRWWGCEVQFGEGCDDLFGIDHNKQMAAHFSKALKEFGESDYDDTQLIEELGGEESDIYDIAERIRRAVRNMMRELGIRFSQRPAEDGDNNLETQSPAEIAMALATKVTEENLQSHPSEKTESDRLFEQTNEEQKIEALISDLTDGGYTEEDAKWEAQRTVTQKYRYKFANARLAGYTVFEVATSQSGVLIVKLNINHPAYTYLELLEDQSGLENGSLENPAATALRFIILALARMEDEIAANETRMAFQATCQRWGHILHRLINEGIINTPE